MAASGTSRFARPVAFTYPAFTLYQVARFCIVLATEMQSVAVGWQVYDITKRPLDLGLVGLAQFLPGILLFLVSGHAADRYDRRRVLTLGYAGFALCSGLLLAITIFRPNTVYPIYAVVALVGVVRSFNAPASRAILPLLVPDEHFHGAFAWGATIFQTATILGPALGGLVYALFRGPATVYGAAMVAAAGAAFSMSGVKPRNRPRPREAFSWKTVLAGMRYIWREKLVLGSISLDLFAVLLGGAVALLPVYAREILKTGPWGLGIITLRSRNRRWSHGAYARFQTVARTCGTQDAVVRGGLWRFHDSVRTFTQPHAVDDRADSGRRDGHGQRGGARNFDSACHTGSDARARECGRHDLYRRLQ